MIAFCTGVTPQCRTGFAAHLERGRWPYRAGGWIRHFWKESMELLCPVLRLGVGCLCASEIWISVCWKTLLQIVAGGIKVWKSFPANPQSDIAIIAQNPQKFKYSKYICLLSSNVRRYKSTLQAIYTFLIELLPISVQMKHEEVFILLNHSPEQNTLRMEFQISAYGLFRNKHMGPDFFSVLQNAS